jgi:hypothetical protein
VQFLPPPTQQSRIGSVLHQRMFEQVSGMRRGPAAEQ